VASLELYRKTEAAAAGGNRTGGASNGVVQLYVNEAKTNNIDPSASVATLMQVLGHEDGQTRLELVEYLGTLSCADSTRALARMAIFSQEANIRASAVKSLKLRRDCDYTDVLVSGLKYPWPQVAEAASDAIVQLGRTDLIANLIDVLEKPDPVLLRFRMWAARRSPSCVSWFA
jgi:HEAT repeat protein